MCARAYQVIVAIDRVRFIFARASSSDVGKIATDRLRLKLLRPPPRKTVRFRRGVRQLDPAGSSIVRRKYTTNNSLLSCRSLQTRRVLISYKHFQTKYRRTIFFTCVRISRGTRVGNHAHDNAFQKHSVGHNTKKYPATLPIVFAIVPLRDTARRDFHLRHEQIISAECRPFCFS